MRIDYLREFLDLSETKSFTETAKRLRISQSSLSKHMSAMEAELGIDLFKRHFSPLQLTESGLVLDKELKAVVSSYDATIRHAKAAQQQAGQTLVVGYNRAAAGWILPKMHRYMERNPTTFELKPVSLSFGELEAAVQEKRIDAAVMPMVSNRLEKNCNSLTIKEIKMLLAIAKKSPLAKYDEVKLVDIDDEVLCIPSEEKYPVLAAHLKSIMGHTELYRNACEFDDSDTVCLGIEQGLFVGVMLDYNRSAYGDRVRFVKLREEEESDFKIPLSVFWLKENEDLHSTVEKVMYLKAMFASIADSLSC